VKGRWGWVDDRRHQLTRPMEKNFASGPIPPAGRGTGLRQKDDGGSRWRWITVPPVTMSANSPCKSYTPARLTERDSCSRMMVVSSLLACLTAKSPFQQTSPKDGQIRRGRAQAPILCQRACPVSSLSDGESGRLSRRVRVPPEAFRKRKRVRLS
jgi:hypothetical protein